MLVDVLVGSVPVGVAVEVFVGVIVGVLVGSVPVGVAVGVLVGNVPVGVNVGVLVGVFVGVLDSIRWLTKTTTVCKEALNQQFMGLALETRS